MSTIVSGVVSNGVVVPSSPLPEGTQVEIQLKSNRPEATPEAVEPVPPAGKQPRTSLADWAEANAEHWGDRLSSEDVEGFTGRRF